MNSTEKLLAGVGVGPKERYNSLTALPVKGWELQ